MWHSAFVGLDAGHNLERALQHIRYAIAARGVGERHGEKCFLPGLSIRNMRYIAHAGLSPNTQWEESFFPKTSVTIVILFWLKWAGYLAVAGLNLLAQLSDRRSPYGV